MLLSIISLPGLQSLPELHTRKFNEAALDTVSPPLPELRLRLADRMNDLHNKQTKQSS